MNHATHNAIVNFIWKIADDILRDYVVRGKYRDVILPMTVIRRLDCLLEPSKDEVLARHAWLIENKIFQQDLALRKVTGYPFYNTSKFTLRRLLDEPSNIRANFENYLDGFSENVRDIIAKFKVRSYLDTLDEHGLVYHLIEKFVSKDINLSPDPVKTPTGELIHEGLSNLGMGYIFEELVRRFNEENNEEAGEHFTPRDIVHLMVNLIFAPIQDQIQSGTYLIYDCACGSGGMLTVADERLKELAGQQGKHIVTVLHGQEVNAETFAICQSDMLIKGHDASKIAYGSTLSKDGHKATKFDFMLANPPYGKSWKVDADALAEGKKKEIKDARFLVDHPGLPDGENLELLPRTSDGQLLFLVNMLSKMKTETPMGSRIAIVHNGSALFTGDAGQGETNVRRWILENDWLEAIIGLPLDMFYNTGIATYVWVLTNRKPKHRKGKVQLIDATDMYRKLRKNLGKKNCEFGEEHVEELTKLFLDFKETPQSKIFDNEDFGYWKITVERPLRLAFQITEEREATLRLASDEKLLVALHEMKKVFGREQHLDFNEVKRQWEDHMDEKSIKLKAPELKKLYDAFTSRYEAAEPVVRRKTKETTEYEPDKELRDTESVSLKEPIEVFFQREVLPYVPDAWIDHEATRKGFEISFAKTFYKLPAQRSLEEIASELFALEKETEGILHSLVKSFREAE
ncbi:MAG: type I restriction-modification system subunit M [Bryobacteraceae bacterium]|nr:type I restriction-modification system subunit M [Bryobacteraceae bacterium]